MKTETRTDESSSHLDGFNKFEIRPQLMEYGKKVSMGAKTDLISCSIQVIANGGETNMHAHGGNDAIWLVMQGKARFYTIGPDGNHDELAAELDKNEPPRRIDHDARQFTVPGTEGGVEREIKFIDKFFGDD